MGTRCVVTGINSEGKAVFASDSVVAPVTVGMLPGYEFTRLWGSDSITELPDAGGPRPALPYFPTAEGFRFGLFTVPPDGTALPEGLDVGAAFAALEAALPGMAAHMEPDHPGMHTTDTVDYEFIVTGRAVLELDDGATVTLGPGDTVIQNGTRHAWRNPFDETCTLVVVLVGARRS